MAALDAATRASIIQQAQQRAQASGKTPEQELYNYAQTQGIDNAGIDDLMGMKSGDTSAWLARTQPNSANPYGAVDISQIKPQGNLGFSAPASSGAFTDAEKAHVTALAQQRGEQQGISPEMALYNYSKEQGINGAGVDAKMGWGAGTTDNWAGNNVPNSQSRTSGGGAPAGNLGFGNGPTPTAPPTGKPTYNDQGYPGGWPSGQPGQMGQSLGQGQPGSAGGRYAQNPYLQGVAQNLTQQSNDNWTRNIAPSLRSGAMAVGGFGGSRQGVVEANALKDQNANLTNTLGNMYLQDYTQGQNRALQSRQGDQSYDLGLRNNDLGFYNASNSYDLGLRNNDLGFYNASNSYDLGRRSNDLGYSQLDSNNAQFGANLGLNTLNAQANWANQGVTAANNMQQTPINYFNSFNANTNSAAGQGGSGQNTTGSSSDPYLQGAGLMQAGQQMYNQYNTQNDPYNIGQGSAYGGQRRGL